MKRIEIVENKKYGGNDYSETVKKDYSDEEVASMINDTNVDLKKKKIDRDEARERKAKFRRLKLLLQRLKIYRRKKRILGKKRRSYSITDPDAAAMMQKDDTIKAAYNEGVATENGLVLDYHISNTSGDSDKLIDLAEGVEENTGKTPESITADSAYKRYLLRAMAKVEIEAGLFYTTYNLEKIYRYVMKTLAQGTREFDLFEDKKIPPLIATLQL